MGQTLSEPVTAKETSSCANSFVKVGSSCMQGWRINMEDAHTHLLSVPEDKDTCFFAVYDGHGGAKVAQYAGNHLHKKIVQSSHYISGNIEEAIRYGFLNLDNDMINDEELRDELAGTTAVVVILKDGRIFCGNVGDSRAVVSVGGVPLPLSYDHKPANENEAKRIIAAGGWVEFNRVNGNLALSRALGDFIFKRNDDKPPEEQIVSAFPDVQVHDIASDFEFILLACDGIWDVLSNQEVVDFCRGRLANKMEPENICEELLSRCLAPDCQMGGLGCDNMTVILVCLLQGGNWEDLCARCARPRPPTPPLDDSPPPIFRTPPLTPSGIVIKEFENSFLNKSKSNDAASKEGTEYKGKEAIEGKSDDSNMVASSEKSSNFVENGGDAMHSANVSDYCSETADANARTNSHVGDESDDDDATPPMDFASEEVDPVDGVSHEQACALPHVHKRMSNSGDDAVDGSSGAASTKLHESDNKSSLGAMRHQTNSDASD